MKAIKPKHLALAMGALLVVSGSWFAQSAWRRNPVQETNKGTEPGMHGNPYSNSNVEAGLKATNARSRPDQKINVPARPAPPIPNRRFTDFTPEQRVQFARQGHGPGG